MRVGSIVIDCNDFDAMVAFWQEALGYVPKYPPKPNDWALLRDPDREWVNVSLQAVPEKKVGKNRLHLDLYADRPDEEIQRLLKLGAKRHPREPEPGEDFVVLEDPEGNLFCVIDTSE